MKQHNTMLDIIIPTYNGSKHLSRLLQSIEKQTYRDFTCVVIDDHSTDNNVQIVKEQFPWVQLIEQSQNQGPAINRNVAIAEGKSPYVVIFDDDTYLEDMYWLEKGLTYMESNPDVGQLAAMIISGFDPDILLDCGILKNHYLFGGVFHNHNKFQVNEKHNKRRRVLGACSAGTIIRRNLFELIGGFDEKYFYPVEDLDVSLRIHLAGYDVRYEPLLVVSHYESQAMGKSLSRKMFMYRRNCLLVLIENFPLLHVASMLLAVTYREILRPTIRNVADTMARRQETSLPDSVKDYLKIYCFLMRNSVQIVKKRIAVNRFRKSPRSLLIQVNRELKNDLAS